MLLSQLFSPATLVATVLLTPGTDASARLVRTRSPKRGAVRQGSRFAEAGNRLLNTVFGLPPTTEERPYAL
jgi:hypothetical protein